jgi:hypothetical protein
MHGLLPLFGLTTAYETGNERLFRVGPVLSASFLASPALSAFDLFFQRKSLLFSGAINSDCRLHFNLLVMTQRF